MNSNSIFPIFDDFGVSPATQSIIVEVMFWTAVYTAYAQIFSRILRTIYRRFRIWSHAHKRLGIFCGNGRDDAVLLTIFALHHGTAAYVMYKGMVENKPMLWRHGYLLETGFEVADLLAMVLQIFPYGKFDGMKKKLLAPFVFHHIPGIVLSAFVMDFGLYQNPHMQAIAFYLLAGAFVGCIAAVYMYQLDCDRQTKQAAVLFTFNVLFFIYCRLLKFPAESHALIVQARHDPSLQPITGLLYGGMVFMSVFNIGTFVELFPRWMRYVKRAIDGVTPIETEAIPRSRDSVVLSANLLTADHAVTGVKEN